MMMMDPLTACQDFITTGHVRQIAAQLRADGNSCKTGGRPSFLAVALRHASEELVDEISQHLLTQEHATNQTILPKNVRLLWYNGLIDGIKSYLGRLSVIEYLELNTENGCDTNSSGTLNVARKRATPQVRRHQNALCYICRFVNYKPHALHQSLCVPCGSFNLSNSLLSLPDSLVLHGKVALVTGGRVKLGFHTALRLLRCGAKVIVSSRYPHDTEAKYLAENDFSSWRARLRIVGADFRTAKDAFNLVEVVKRQVKAWDRRGCLDILINNAAQTLTDPLHTEIRAIEHEKHLQGTLTSSGCTIDSGYQPRVRGGHQSGWESSLQWQTKPMLEDHTTTTSALSARRSAKEDGVATAPSSWVQSMSEIPYEDLMTAHSVNFFVPLILCRELLSIMGGTMLHRNHTTPDGHLSDTDIQSKEAEKDESGKSSDKISNKPIGYIINVSSREGLFEDNLGSDAKNGRHVHTNTSKAALNMITETEAYNCWKSRRIAMNTVDPGYMSAAPEMEKYGDCPITFEDGAARVLWPIAIAEKEDRVLYGRFLKHFGAVNVEVGAGR